MTAQQADLRVRFQIEPKNLADLGSVKPSFPTADFQQGKKQFTALSCHFFALAKFA